MATFSTSTTFSMATTATLQAWGTELNTWMNNVGMIQTADTGQINWTTQTLPGGLGASIGYEIWKFSDSSLYFKWEFLTNSTVNTASNIGVFLTVGTGSDGAGNITGIIHARSSIGSNSGSLVNAGGHPSYLCHNSAASFFGINFKQGAGTNPCVIGFAIEKMVDSAAAVSGTGIVVSTMPTSTALAMNKYAYRTASVAASYGVNTAFCLVPANVTTSVVGTDKQVFLHSQPSPRAINSNFLCTVVTSELPAATTFTATLVGATSHTYIALGTGLGLGNSVSPTSATWTCAMLWE